MSAYVEERLLRDAIDRQGLTLAKVVLVGIEHVHAAHSRNRLELGAKRLEGTLMTIAPAIGGVTFPTVNRQRRLDSSRQVSLPRLAFGTRGVAGRCLSVTLRRCLPARRFLHSMVDLGHTRWTDSGRVAEGGAARSTQLNPN